jgi:hypothetical protein
MGGDLHSPVVAPFVEIIIGAENLSIPPQFVTNFEYNDTAANTGDSWSFDVFDTTFGLLETLLAFNVQLAMKQRLKFRWGYYQNMSDYRYGEILASEPGEITRAGVNVHVEGCDRGSAQPESQTKKTKTWRGPISKIAQEIAEHPDHAWAHDVETTGSILDKEERTTATKEKKFMQDNQTDLDFLNSLTDKAKSKSRPNAGDYKLFFDAAKDPPKMHFHPSRAVQEKPRLYVVNTSRLGVVKSFSPEYQGDALYAEGKSAVMVTYRDKHTKEIITLERKAETFEGAPVDAKYVPVETGHSSKLEVPSFTLEEAKAFLDTYYSRLSNLVMNATLTVEGDPTLQPDSYVDILVLTPTGKRYFTSGIYYVVEVKHTVAAGDYESEMTLVKNSLDTGDIKNESAPVVSTAKSTAQKKSVI